MSASDATRQRLLLRATLVAGMVLALFGLFAVLKARRAGPETPPALARSSVRVRVVDAAGRVVPGAEVFVKSTDGAEPARARWSPRDGVLMLPRRARPHDVRVTARGYRIRDVAGVGTDRTITLERGLRLRVELLDVPATGLPKGVRVMLRVRPLDADPDAPGGLAAEALVDLMDNLGGAGPQDIPRGSFGYPVSLAQARHGILLPRPGRYHVRWGLIDLRANTWFSLGAPCGRDVEIGPEGDRLLRLALTTDDLQACLDGLAEGVRRAGEEDD